MKGMVIAFLGTIATIPIVPVLGQLGSHSEGSIIKDLGVGSAQMILAFVAVILGYTIFKMFLLWRKDVDQSRKESKESAELLRGVVLENSIALAALNVANKEMKGSVYHLSSIISNCDEVRKVAARKEQKKNHED